MFPTARAAFAAGIVPTAKLVRVRATRISPPVEYSIAVTVEIVEGVEPRSVLALM